MSKTHHHFSELEAWKRAEKLLIQIYKATRNFPKEELYLLCNQMRRAATSIGANIAEGNERVSKKEKAHFLYIAKGSCAEVEQFLWLARDLEYIGVKQFGKLTEECQIVQRQLGAWIKSLNQIV